MMEPEPVSAAVELLNLRDAWVSPEGVWHPVRRWGHEEYGYDNFNMGWEAMNQAGWIKLTESDWRWDGDGVSQPQLEAIFDWHCANSEEFDATNWKIR